MNIYGVDFNQFSPQILYGVIKLFVFEFCCNKEREVATLLIISDLMGGKKSVADKFVAPPGWLSGECVGLMTWWL